MQYLSFSVYLGLGLTALAIHYFAASLAHILVSVITLVIFAIAAIQALLTRIQSHLLKHHPLGENVPLLSALPPVETMRDLMFKSLGAGFIFLTLSFIGALIFLPNLWQDNYIYKTIITGIVWLLFASILYGQHRWGWNNRILIVPTLVGVILLSILYFICKWNAQY